MDTVFVSLIQLGSLLEGIRRLPEPIVMMADEAAGSCQ
jgi:hypothetical protein